MSASITSLGSLVSTRDSLHRLPPPAQSADASHLPHVLLCGMSMSLFRTLSTRFNRHHVHIISQCFPKTYATKSMKAFDFTDDFSRKENTRDNKFCQLVSQLQPPIDWNAFKGKHTLKSRLQSFDFELRVMSCLIRQSDASVDRVQLCKSFIEFLGDRREDKPLFHLYYLSLLSIVDINKYKSLMIQEIKQILNQHTTHARYAPFAEMVRNVAQASAEDCSTMLKLASDHWTMIPSQLISQLREISYKQSIADAWLIGDEASSFDSLNNRDVKKWLDHFSREPHISSLTRDTFVGILHKMQKHNLSFGDTDYKQLMHILNHLGYKWQVTEMQGNQCKSCGSSLPSFTGEEMALLQKKFYHRVILNYSIYNSTTPEELTQFISSIGRKKFSCVLDVLNVSYSQEARFLKRNDRKYVSPREIVWAADVRVQQENVIKVLSSLQERFNRILLIGRKHQYRWTKLMAFLSSHRSSIFYYPVDARSKDDLFMIYSALTSADTFIVSGDTFRDHAHAMNDDTFERWLRNRRIANDEQSLKYAGTWVCEAKVHVQSEHLFHIPFGDINNMTTAKWLCVRDGDDN